jgi:arylsulfatase
VQYFEMLGNRALYKDGWMAVVRHGRLPWIGGTYEFDKDTWELYDLTHDFSQGNDLAPKYPDKLKSLQDGFWIEAEKYQVLPLDDRLAERFNPALRPSLIEGRKVFTYYNGARIADSSAAPTQNRSFSITADLDIPQGGSNGVLLAVGGVAGGISLYIKDGRPIFESNYVGQQRTKIACAETLAPGPNVVRMEFRYDGGGLGKGGTVSLFINDKKVGEGRVEATGWIGKYSADETFDIGADTGSPVSDDYASPNRFTGTIKKVVIDSAPAKLTADEQEKIKAAERKFRVATE